MRKVLEISKSIMFDFIFEVVFFIKNNVRYFGYMLNISVPYVMYYFGMIGFESRGKYTIGGEIFIPIFVAIISSYCKSFANKIGKGSTIPTPLKRFTNYDKESGEVTVDTNRLQELLLYMADLEDWMNKKRLL